MILSDDTTISVRNLTPAELEDYRDHLLRLEDGNRAARFAGPADDDFIRSYCLRLVSGPCVVVGALNREIIRGACEVDISAESGVAKLAFSVESTWQGRGVGLHLFKEALITCFGLGAEQIMLFAPASNGRMQRLAKRFGFEADPSSGTGAFVKKLDSLAPVIAVA